MPLVLLAVGAALLIAAIRGTLQGTAQNPGLLDLLFADFVGPGNFFAWVAAIGIVGAIGYVKPLRGVSDAFIVLIIIVFVLAANKAGKDFFSSFNAQLVTGTQQATATPSNSAGQQPAFQFNNYSGSIPINDPSLAPIGLEPIPTLGGVTGP